MHRRHLIIIALLAVFTLAACSTSVSPSPVESDAVVASPSEEPIEEPAEEPTVNPNESIVVEPSGELEPQEPIVDNQMAFPDIDPELLIEAFETQNFEFDSPIPSEDYDGADFVYGEQPERGTSVSIIHEDGNLLEVRMLFEDGLTNENAFDLGFISGVLGGNVQSEALSSDLFNVITAAEPGTYTDTYGTLHVSAEIGLEEDPNSIQLRFRDAAAVEATE